MSNAETLDAVQNKKSEDDEVFTVSGTVNQENSIAISPFGRQQVYGNGVKWNWIPLTNVEKIKVISVATFLYVMFVIAIILTAVYAK